MAERSSVDEIEVMPFEEDVLADTLPVDRSTIASMTRLASDLDAVTRISVRLRPDGLVEVVLAGAVIGFVDHVSPVFVALAGSRPTIAVEVAQRRTLALAVESLRSAHADYD